MKRVTIQDVAKAAGVSPSSISNYFNDRQHLLKPATQERIREAIAALAYSPNTAARQLKTGHSPMLGLLSPRIAHPYHSKLADSLDEAAQAHGFRLILGSGHSTEALEFNFINELVSYGIRGIVVACELINPQCLTPFIKRGVAFVLLDGRAGELFAEGVDIVNLDNAISASMAVDHLVALGHKSIAYITPNAHIASRTGRLKGYTEAILHHKLGEPQIIGQDLHWASEQGDAALVGYIQHVVSQFLTLDPMPTAIIAMNDMLAIGLLAALRERGIQSPEQVAVVGIDDILLSQLTVPSLSSLRPPYTEMAESIMQNMKSRLLNPQIERRICTFQPELIVRQSSGTRRS